MVIIIRIDISKIENWRKVIEFHKDYVENNILPKLIENINSDISYILLGVNELTDKEMINKQLLKLTLGKKEQWTEFIERYNKKILTPEYIIRNEFEKSNSYSKNIIENIRKRFKDKQDEIIILNKLGEKINKGTYTPDKKLSLEEKREIMNGLINDSSVEIIKKIEAIFNYKEFGQGTKWNRNIFLTLTGVEVCPYCNRQYITSFNIDEQNRTTADLDHYYSQSKYPFLALSIYNFIPSCAICNRNFKNDSDKEVMYPYDECFDDEDVKFITDFNDKNEFTYLIGEDLKFNLELTEGKKNNEEKFKRIENSKNVFNLENVYFSNKSYVKDLIKRFYYYNEKWIDEVENTYGSILSLNRTEIIELEFGNYLSAENFSKKPLAKLTKDILDELGLNIE
ncbi:hypothetical protein [Clostridium sp. YIM B02569]|uniref:hypothetical protein n=1 Tax=Clostridium sp. YIM B02569 TaxID=2911967 RepID=UPI001EEB3A48|nr:hypothetical protein [Clostridium sp. YIM B02569]